MPIEIDCKAVASKIIVYSGEEDEYLSFTTPEAYHATIKHRDCSRLIMHTAESLLAFATSAFADDNNLDQML